MKKREVYVVFVLMLMFCISMQVHVFGLDLMEFIELVEENKVGAIKERISTEVKMASNKEWEDLDLRYTYDNNYLTITWNHISDYYEIYYSYGGEVIIDDIVFLGEWPEETFELYGDFFVYAEEDKELILRIRAFDGSRIWAVE